MPQKTAYIRDARYRDACRAMPCQHCGSEVGVTWAHSNQAIHGKGLGIKASDQYVAALCQACHMHLDQGKDLTQGERVALWDAAHRETVETATKMGIWPT